jgi:hypothetical protein
VDSVVDAAAAVVAATFQRDLQTKFSVLSSDGENILIISEMGAFMHACEGDMLYESTNTKIPYFNAPIYLENKVPPPTPGLPFLQLIIVVAWESR